MKRKLALVENTAPKAVDLYDRWRAEIMARDWDAVHKRADRSQPVTFADAKRGGRWS